MIWNWICFYTRDNNLNDAGFGLFLENCILKLDKLEYLNLQLGYTHIGDGSLLILSEKGKNILNKLKILKLFLEGNLITK